MRLVSHAGQTKRTCDVEMLGFGADGQERILQWKKVCLLAHRDKTRGHREPHGACEDRPMIHF